MLHRFLPRRLDMQMALLCALALACTMPWFIIHETGKELDHFLGAVEEQTTVLAGNVAVTSIEYIVTNDFSSLDKLLMRSALFPGIIDIQVTNSEGEILSDVYLNEEHEPEARFVHSPLLELPARSFPQTLFEENRLVVWSPVESGALLGWVKLNYSLENANAHKDSRIHDYLIDAGVITAALLGLLILAMRRPLRMISAAADFSSRLDEKSGEQIPMHRQSIELDKLYLALNKVSSSLAEQDAAIKKGLKDLETQKHALDEHSIVSITDVHGNITYANDKLLSSTGYELEELIGKNPRILRSGNHGMEFYKDMWDTISQGKVWHGDIMNHGKQGQRIWMQTTIVPFLDVNGRPYEYVAIQSNITAQKETEALLAIKNKSLEGLTEQLENKVKDRTAELQEANNELLRLNNIKSEFVSVVSHELRTPLTSIKSFAEILEDDFDDLDSDTRRHYLSIINEESLRLGRLINDVLDLQKIDAGKMSWHNEETDLRNLTSTTIELFSKSYLDKGLGLHLDMTDAELVVDIDSDKIKQVLSNLLSNAYKFTDQGDVTVELKKVIQHPNILIVIDDNAGCEHAESRDYLESLLQGMGIKVISCENAEQALEIVQDGSCRPDLVITDITLPGMNAARLIESLRSSHAKLPIIAVAHRDNNVNLESLLNCNITAVLEKPFQPARVAGSIEKVLGSILHVSDGKQMVEISVADSGTGIPEHELDKVFERFHQVDSSETREKGGSGLGLAICQDIVKHHGGQLWVTSIHGEGSRFSFNLPLLDTSKERAGKTRGDADVVTQESITSRVG